MGNNHGIFNRGESLMRAQQEYDVFDFIANRPEGRHRASVIEAEPALRTRDSLTQFFFPQAEDAAPNAKARGLLRPLLKMMIKATAAVPVMVLYVGPRKVAQVVKPILEKVIHLIPHLLQKVVVQLQKQLQRAEPFLNKVGKVMKAVVNRIKTTTVRMQKALRQTKEFMQEKLIQPLAQMIQILQKQVAQIISSILPEKKASFNILKAVNLISQFIERKVQQFTSDIKDEIKDVAGIIHKIFQPVVKVFQAIKNVYQPTISFIKNLPAMTLEKVIPIINESFKYALDRVDEAVITPFKKVYRKTKELVEEVVDKSRQMMDAFVSKTEILLIPMINLLAATQQFIQHRKEKIGMNLIRWLKHANKRYKSFSAKAVSVIRRAKEKIQDSIKEWFYRSWVLKSYHWLLKCAAGWVCKFLNQVERVLAKKDFFLAKIRHFLKFISSQFFFVMKKIPSAVYLFVEWAFGRAGVLVLQAMSYLARSLIKGIRYTAHLFREVVLELIQLPQ